LNPTFREVTSAVPQVLELPESTKPVGLYHRMKMVLDLHKQARDDNDYSEDLVHDLRVSLRRCRTMAKALREVDPEDGDWKAMDKAAKKLFKALGDMRDLHVLDGWLTTLAPPEDSAAKILHHQFKEGQKYELRKVKKAVKKFDRNRWKEWTKALPERAEKVTQNPAVFRTLAKERMREAFSIHQEVIENPSEDGWHQVRIAIKRFRYIVENFIPDLYAEWGKDLETLQDFLGDVHDLDVLRQEIADLDIDVVNAIPDVWHEIFHKERESRLEAYRSRTTGPESLWSRWEKTLTGLPMEVAG
jgi:CHAD domain-containing protein